MITGQGAQSNRTIAMAKRIPFGNGVHLPIPNGLVFSVHLVTSTAETLRHHANRLCRIDRIPLAYLSLRARSPLRISDLRNKPLLPDQPGRMEPGQCCDTFVTRCGVCVPTYMRNTYPEVRSVLRAIIACRPEDSLRPVLSYPSSSLAIVPQQTHDHNPSFPSHLAFVSFYLPVHLTPSPSLSLSLSHSRSFGSSFSISGYSHPYHFPPQGEFTCRILLGSLGSPFLLWSRHLSFRYKKKEKKTKGWGRDGVRGRRRKSLFQRNLRRAYRSVAL